MVGNTVVIGLLISLAYCVVMGLMELRFEERLAMVGAMLLFAFICWAIYRDSDDNDFDVLG